MKKTVPAPSGRKQCGFCIGLGLLLAASFTAAQANAGQLPETLDLNAQEKCVSTAQFGKDQKSAPNFNHAQHATVYLKGNAEFTTNTYTDEFTCTACHLGAQSQDELLAADSCARLTAALETQEAPNVKNYFHAICQQCHKNMKKAEKATGPTSCKDCHTK